MNSGIKHCLVIAISLNIGMIMGKIYNVDSVYIASMGVGVFIFLATAILINEIKH